MTTMQYVAQPTLDNPRSKALRELMNAANNLEYLQNALEKLYAFYGAVSYDDLKPDTGIIKTGEEIVEYDYDDLYRLIESHLEQRVKEQQTKVLALYAKMSKLKIRGYKPVKPEPVSDELPY